MAADITHDGVDHVAAGQRLGARAQRVGERQAVLQALGFGGGGRRGARRVDGDDMQIAIELLAHAMGAADDVLGVGVGPDAGHDGFARAPHGLDGAVTAVGLHIVVHVFGRAPQRQLA